MNYKYLYEKTPPLKLFFKVAVPSIISMVMASLFLIVDGILVGQLLGGDALASITLVFPLVIFAFAVGDLVGVGSSVPIAIALGEKDEQTASEIFTFSCIFIIVLGCFSGILLFFFSEKFLILVGASESLMALSKAYLKPYAFLAPLISIFFAVDNYLRICGKVKFSMYLNILMTIIGCILEFLLLYVFRFGIWAAGFTYCFSLFICSLIGFYPFFKNNLLLKFVKPRFSFNLIKRIVKSGFPTILSSISSRITSIFLNILLLKHGGQLAVAAYAVIIYIDGIIVSLLYGLSDSLQPAIGYNFGAKNKKRINSLLKVSYGSSFILSALLIIIVYFFGDFVIYMFVNKDEIDLFVLTKEALSIFSITFFFRWFASITQSYFTAIEKPNLAITVSTIMTFIVPCILLFTLPNKYGLNGLWSITPISSFIACILALILFIKNQKTLLKTD